MKMISFSLIWKDLKYRDQETRIDKDKMDLGVLVCG